MKLSAISVVLLVTLVLPTSVMKAQEAQNQPEDSAISSVLSAPDSLTGSNSQLLPDVQEDRDTIVGGVRVSGFYDDAAFFRGTRQLSDYQYSILPNVGLRLFQPHTQWNLDYSGGITFDQRTLSRGLASHNFRGELHHNFTRHLMLNLREGYLVTSNPFVHLGQNQSLALSAPGQINSLVLTPQAEQIANASSADLTYQFSRSSSLGVDGSFSALRFRHVGDASTSGLIDTRSVSGRLFYVHEITRSQKVGVEYQLQDLRFQHGQSRTVDQRLLLFDEITLRPSMTLSLFAGPDRSHTHGVLSLNPNLSIPPFTVLRNRWSPAAGATYTWKGKHAGVRLSGLRTVTDGGGLLGATLSNIVTLEIQTALSPRWSAGAGLNYLDGRSIQGIVGGTGRHNTKQAHCGVERSITREISAQVRYEFVQQGQSGIPNQISAGKHNQIELALTYSFTKLLKQ